MSGETLDYKKHLRLQIGQYCQVHEEDTPRNSLRPRTKGAISLGPSGNLQGGYKFMALSTGKKIIRRSWDVIPMPDTVIARVNTLGGDQPEQLTFTDRHGRLIGDTDAPADITAEDVDEVVDADDIPGVDDDDEIPGVDVELPGVDVALPDENADNAPQIVEIHDLDTPAPDPPTVEVETVTDAPAEPDVAEPQGARRSTRVRTQPKAYAPSMSGTRYSYAVTQLETGCDQPGCTHVCPGGLLSGRA